MKVKWIRDSVGRKSGVSLKAWKYGIGVGLFECYYTRLWFGEVPVTWYRRTWVARIGPVGVQFSILHPGQV